MHFTFIDYSADAYPEGVVPRERRGKFIQIRNDGHEFLVFAPKELCVFHANIAERFFAGLGLTGRYNAKRDAFTPRAPGWTIVGGGHFSADDVKQELSLSGVSLAYGRFDPRGLLGHLSGVKELAGYRIVIGA